MEIYTYAGSNLASAKEKFIVKSGLSHSLTSSGSSAFQAGDYVQSVGMSGRTNAYLTGEYNANAFTGINNTICAYMKANVKKNNTIIGLGNGGFDTLGLMFYTTGTPSNLNYFISKGSQATDNNSNQTGGSFVLFNSQGFYCGVGNASGTELYRNGKRIGHKLIPGTGTFSSGIIRSVNNFNNARISVDIIIPRALTSAECLTLNNIVQLFEFERGRSVIEFSTLPIYCFVGDSLTAGANTDGSGNVTLPYPVQFESDFSLTSSNCLSTSNNGMGVGGTTITQMKASALLSLTDLYDSRATKNTLFFFGGTNDLIQGGSGATVLSRLIDYCTYAKSVGFKIIVGTLGPTNANATYSSNVGSYNSLILNDTGGSGGGNRFTNGELADGIADVSSIPELSNYSDLTYFMNDGIHYRNAAYTLIKDVFKAKYNLL